MIRHFVIETRTRLRNRVNGSIRISTIISFFKIERDFSIEILHVFRKQLRRIELRLLDSNQDKKYRYT